MIGTSLFDYIHIRFWITTLRAITPLSFLYGVFRLNSHVPLLSPPHLQLFFDGWAIAEVGFYLFAYLPLKGHSQRHVEHPPLVSQPERQILFARCLKSMSNSEQYLSKWFLDAPLSEIKTDNVKEFFRWAFFNTATVQPDYEDELEEYVSRLEVALGRKFNPGRGEAKCLRLTMDAVDMVHRPLVWYMVAVFTVDNITHCSMLYNGFTHYRPSAGLWPRSLPIRPLTLFSRCSPVKSIPYWYRPHKSTTKLPIVLIHGIGIGLYPYTNFLAQLNDATNLHGDTDVGIIALEILPVSFRMTGSILAKDEMCRQIQTILLRHAFGRCVLVSHSYGSVVTTHLMKHPRTSRHVSSVVLVDPVSILLHMPDVAYNFTYRSPRQANEFQLWYFASKDMGVSHTLARGFFWSENILWKEDLDGKKLTVFLAGKDLIVNTRAVAKYLTAAKGHTAIQEAKDEWIMNGDTNEGPDGIKVVWSGELDHASIFDSKNRRQMLVDEVLKHAGGGV